MRHLQVLILAVLFAAVPVLACDAPVTAAVVKEIARVKPNVKVVYAKQTNGRMRPVLAKTTTEYRSSVIAEEILADFEARNAASAELDVANAADLPKYMNGGVVDWERLDRDFPGVDAVAELSRPGCDSQAAFGVLQVRFRFRDGREQTDGYLYQLARQPDSSWRVERTAAGGAEHLAQ
jgi:hypothetical protein